jgi:alpha-glucosidase
MVWDGSAQGGFTTGTPWLPIKAEQAARHVEGQLGAQGSVLEHYRAMLAFRKSSVLRSGRTRFLDVGEPLLAFQRGEGEGALLCLFNLSPLARSVTLGGVAGIIGPSQAVLMQGDRLTLGPNAVAFLTVTGRVTVQD